MATSTGAPRVVVRVLKASVDREPLELYCQLQCGDTSVKTTVHKTAKVASWTDAPPFVFGMKKPLGPELQVHLMDHNRMLRDERLGEVTIAVASLPAHAKQVMTFPVVNPKTKERSGEIELEVVYQPEHPSPTPAAAERKPSLGSLPSLSPSKPTVNITPRQSPRTSEDESKSDAEEKKAFDAAAVAAEAAAAVESAAQTMAAAAEDVAAKAADAKAVSDESTATIGKESPKKPSLLTRQSGVAIHPPNHVVVSILEARDIPAMDGSKDSGTSDAFVKVKFNGMKEKTSIQKKTLNPKWRERFFFPYHARSDERYLDLIMEDDDMFQNDFIGYLCIDLVQWKDLFDMGKTAMWLALSPKPPKTQRNRKVADLSESRRIDQGLGKLCIAIEFVYLEKSRRQQGEKDNTTALPKVSSTPRSTNAGSGGQQYADDEGEAEDQDEPSKEEAEQDAEKREEERKKREEERQKQFAELSNIQFAPGDYQIKVRIIEVRDLKPMDLNGTCDPVVSVECLGQRQFTMVKQNTVSCIFDEFLYFNFKKMDPETIQQASIKITVMDADAPRRVSQNSLIGRLFSDSIGSFAVDIPYVYFQKHHEIHRRWVALVGDELSKRESIQGYLRLSIVVLGPGDKLKIHAPSENRDSDNEKADDDLDSLVLVPPRVTQKLAFLVVTIHKAIELPNMDDSFLKSGGIDAFVRVKFGNDELETRYETVKGGHNLGVEFDQELWFPVLMPTMTNNILISVWDEDLSNNELVGNLNPLSFSEVQKDSSRYQKQWMNIYGPPLGIMMDSDATRFMHKHPAHASTYRGRVLVSMRVEDGKKSVNDQPHVRSLMDSCRDPPSTRYTLRAGFYYGTEIPEFASKTRWGNNSRMSIRVSMGKNHITTSRVDNIDGVCHWNQYVDMTNMAFPDDWDQMPDIFVYLIRQQLSESVCICYARYKAKDLFVEDINSPDQGIALVNLMKMKEPEWIVLTEDHVHNMLKDKQFPGNVLLSLRLERTQDEKTERRIADIWRKEVTTSIDTDEYTLMVHAFQGRGLPAADSNGLLDPFLKLHCFGTRGEVSKRMCTRDPCFYETVAMNMRLPKDPRFLPLLSIRVFDYDKWDGDDYVGRAMFALRNVRTIESYEYNKMQADGTYEPPSPEWQPIHYLQEGDSEGELLLSFELIHRSDGAKVEPPSSIHPATEDKLIEITCLGCRGLQPLGFVPVNMPAIKFEIGEVTRHNAPKCTNPSSKPSARNPNYLERILIPVKMPIDKLFAPRLNITVFDQLLGGFYKPALGVCSVDLSTKMPFSKGVPNPCYIPPGGDTAAGNPYLDRPLDLSSFPGTSTRRRSDANPTPTPTPPNSLAQPLDTGAGAIPQSLGWKQVFARSADEEEPEYMRNRRILNGTVEEECGSPPFENYTLFRGNMLIRSGKFGQKSEGTFRTVGRFKGVIRIISSRNEKPLFDMEHFLRPEPYLIRVYVLDGLDIMPKDENNKCDPYVRISLGDGRKNFQMIDDRKNHQPETLRPKFHTLYELKAELPGASELRLEVMDYDFFALPTLPLGLGSKVGSTIGGDDFVGCTLIDLEDRLFSAKWQRLGKIEGEEEKRKPVELRPLYAPSSTQPQGNVRLWLEILTEQEMDKFPPMDISLPPRKKFEIRVIVYKARDVIAGDIVTKMNDLYVKCWLQGDPDNAQSTDVHWRARDGKASFNWRMKFDIELPLDPDNEAERGALMFQMWDKDITYNDFLGDALVDIRRHLREAFRSKEGISVYGVKKEVRIASSKGRQVVGPYESSSIAPQSNKTALASSPTYASAPGLSSPSAARLSPSNVSNDMTALDIDESEPFLPKAKSDTDSSRSKKKQPTSIVDSFKQRLGLQNDMPEDTRWIAMHQYDRENPNPAKTGELLISVEILPKEYADAHANGFGRSEPNNFPTLPEPAGRLDFSSMWNPLYVLEALLGEGIYHTVTSVVMCGLIVAFFIFAGPLLNVFFTIIQMVPYPYDWVVFGILLALVIFSLCYCSYRCRRMCSSNDAQGDEDKGKSEKEY